MKNQGSKVLYIAACLVLFDNTNQIRPVSGIYVGYLSLSKANGVEDYRNGPASL